MLLQALLECLLRRRVLSMLLLLLRRTRPGLTLGRQGNTRDVGAAAGGRLVEGLLHKRLLLLNWLNRFLCLSDQFLFLQMISVCHLSFSSLFAASMILSALA